MWVPRVALSLSLLTGCYSGVGSFDSRDTAGGDAGEGEGAGEDAGEDEGEGEGWEVAATPMRRLTRAQLLRSTRDLLAIPDWEPVGDLPDDGANEEQFVLPNLLAAGVSTNPTDFSRYRAAARGATEAAFATDEDLAQRLGCTPTIPDEACVVEYLATSCERAFGRAMPADDPVLLALVDIVRDGHERMGTIRQGVQWAMAAVVQSPEFLYFYPEGDGEGGMRAFSRARSLALLFTDSVLDDELLAHARDGSLDDPDVVDAQIDRLITDMLEDPSRRGAVVRFFDDWWGMGLVESVGKDPGTFPEFDESLRSSMRQEIERWLADIVFERRADFRDVLVSDRMFVNDDLAALYGLPGEFGDEVVQVERPADSPRTGLLSTAAFLAVNAHPSLTSPSARGRFVLERLLCFNVGGVPADVDPVIPPPVAPETTRQRFEERHAEPACAACHDQMDPPGFALEEFDALGRYRTQESVYFDGQTYDLPVDTTGELGGVRFDDSKQMAAIIAEDPGFTRCVTRQVLRQALGRDVSSAEAPALDELTQGFVDDGLDFIELLRQVARHRVFTSFTEAE